ncbi:STAS/SEC14 domain-containing protein [Aequorivita marina]|uniref:STAS/SEC14 domain-containing protein n=1 Tax=Aequorivita marina TaxID=3073654 RepID=UPI00287460A9|nr:STAS/SEC14 domain-containing protein [Aequorivita sp. S2608]MDS1296944.1 STAS/SEC14 domain-containing protein [Aequorivita sp. S2608]
MFTIINGIPEDILGVVISGKTTETDYDQLNPLLEKHKTMNGAIKLFVEIDNLDYTAKAMWEDFKAGLHYWQAIKSVAIVTDKKMLENSLEALGAVVPGMKIEGFSLDERQKGLNWLKKQEN